MSTFQVTKTVVARKVWMVEAYSIRDALDRYQTNGTLVSNTVDGESTNVERVKQE